MKFVIVTIFTLILLSGCAGQKNFKKEKTAHEKTQLSLALTQVKLDKLHVTYVACKQTSARFKALSETNAADVRRLTATGFRLRSKVSGLETAVKKKMRLIKSLRLKNKTISKEKLLAEKDLETDYQYFTKRLKEVNDALRMNSQNYRSLLDINNFYHSVYDTLFSRIKHLSYELFNLGTSIRAGRDIPDSCRATKNALHQALLSNVVHLALLEKYQTALKSLEFSREKGNGSN